MERDKDLKGVKAVSVYEAESEVSRWGVLR